MRDSKHEGNRETGRTASTTKEIKEENRIRERETASKEKKGRTREQMRINRHS